MANETITTVVGNLTADPELRFTRSSASPAPFRAVLGRRRARGSLVRQPGESGRLRWAGHGDDRGTFLLIGG